MSERQHELTAIMKIAPDRRNPLVRHLERTIGYQRHDKAANGVLRKIDNLHFMSLFTFAAEDITHDLSTPLPEPAWLVLEASFDGSARAFTNRLAEAFAQELDDILVHCEGFKSGDDSAKFIRDHRRTSQCVYVGAPGLERRQIEQESWFRATLRQVRDTVIAPNPAAHAHFVRTIENLDRVFKEARSQPKHAHPARLDQPAPPTPLRVRAGQPIATVLMVLVPLVLIALYVLAFGPWPELDMLVKQRMFLVFLGPAIAVLAYGLVSAGSGVLLSAFVILGALASAAGVAAISPLLPPDIFLMSRFALAGIAVVVGTIFFWLYALETRENESEQFPGAKDKIDTRLIDENRMRLVCAHENSPGCMQNHFVNLSIVKGGILRLFSLRFVLWSVHVLGVIYFNRGMLGAIPSIHFARWMVLPEGEFGKNALLLFMTNYDASWDSYLGDFVDGASEGVSGIWSNTGGFPRTWFLVVAGGSRFEKQFKAYARNGQLRTSAWFSAYPNISVQEKLSNAALRRGFEKRNKRNRPIKTPTIRAIAKQDDLLRRL